MPCSVLLRYLVTIALLRLSNKYVENDEGDVIRGVGSGVVVLVTTVILGGAEDRPRAVDQ